MLLLETVLLVFALTYYALAVKGDHQMAGIRTRLDALYSAATNAPWRRRDQAVTFALTVCRAGDVRPRGSSRGMPGGQLSLR